MPIWPFKSVPREPARTREELSRQYLRELQEMIDDREIGAEVARDMLETMFDPPLPWQPRRVTEAVWERHLAELERDRRR